MAEYMAANGQTITDEMIDGWCEYYDKGDFPPGERTVGGVVRGRPSLSSSGTSTLNVKIPSGMKMAIEKKAAAEGLSLSAATRVALSNWLLANA